MPYVNTMLTNNMFYVRGYTFGFVVGTQRPVVDYLIQQTCITYPYVSANNSLTCLPWHNVSGPPLVNLTTPRPVVGYGGEHSWIVNPLH